jgi:exodeoxyribonuclease VII large subunit
VIQREEAQRPLTVSELSVEIRDRVRAVTGILVKGEVAGTRRNSRGCLSFDIKDSSCTVRAWIWDRDAARLGVLPEDGQQYIFRGRADYWRTGNLVFVVDQVRYDDVGRLRAQLEALRHKLEVEGAFAAERKRSLPFLPRTVALITSPTGAVIHDLQETIWERFPNMEILIYPAQVQGTASPASVVAALQQCNGEGRAQVVIIARGGGSFEELYAFNTETVARAILDSRVPVVTALGHTSDRTIADLVSDLECRTPTAAGERVVPRKADLKRQIAERHARLRREIGHRLLVSGERLDGRRRRLAQLLPAMVRHRLEHIVRCQTQLARLSPAHQLARRQDALAASQQRLHRAAQELVQRQIAALENRDGQRRARRALAARLRTAEESLTHRRQRLAALSPFAVLGRGYSITLDAETGQVLRAATSTAPGRKLQIQLAQGELAGLVEEIKETVTRGRPRD